jgi:DNA processing protein
MATDIPTRRFVLWLSLTPRLGPKGIQNVLDRIALQGMTAEEFLALEPGRKKLLFGLHPEAAGALTRSPADMLTMYGPVEERLRRLGVDWVTPQDATYPARLTERLEQPPTVLYAYGNRGLLERATFAAFSSRKTSQRGLERMERVVEKWVLKPSVLVAGHSTPAYQRSAVVPLRWGSPRIMVLDCGVYTALSEDLTTEPFRTARLWRYNFDPKTDLVLSACRPGDLSLGVHNKDRDWLISAIADDLLFIEARDGGVMEKIGLSALRQKRPVWALDWPEYSDSTRGNERLLEAGAKAVRE